MLKKIVQTLIGKECELRERMLRTIILVGGFATIIASTEIFLVMEINNTLLALLFLLLLAMAVAFVATFKYRKYDVGSILLGFVIVVIVIIQ